MTGPVVIIEPSPDTPLVWFDIAIRGGAAADPRGVEGLHRHAALLARRGAGRRDRAELDETLDNLGAALEVGISRDALSLSGLALSRHLDAVIDLAADILADPRFDEAEHARLLRETPQVLDEIRDDDSALATRWFDWLCCPGHAYGRTSLGTEGSLARIERSAAIDLWRREVVADNLVIGLAGDVDEPTAARIVARLVARLPAGARPASTTMYEPAVAGPIATPVTPGRRVILVDKSDRTQAQLRVGHLSIRYGDDDTAALAIGEAVLGGMFSSRLMQEIRVKRGWSYGAGCALRRSRLPHWFEVWMAAGIEVAGPAIALTLELLADYAANGPTDDEVDFARDYLVGSMPFHVATARQRMQLAVRDAVFDLPPDYTAKLPVALAALTPADVRAACARCLSPASAVIVAVTTAEQAQASLEAAGAGTLTVVDHDEY
ncbi:MAG: insulinase family protein [Deltaproteobacteria bacterium]|nr:insulinase family protein [Deltaproteobacteria bacterium]MDQ3300228.1 insulinase family protein [Myxococcota bacterium]